MITRHYIGGGITIWRENGEDIIDVERIGSHPDGYVALITLRTWFTPETAKEVAHALITYADAILQDKEYFDPFAKEEPHE